MATHALDKENDAAVPTGAPSVVAAKSKLKVPGSGLKPPTDFRSPAKAILSAKKRTAAKGVNGSTARPRRALHSRDTGKTPTPLTPGRKTSTKRGSPSEDANTRPAKTRRGASGTRSSSRTAGASHRRTRSRADSNASASDAGAKPAARTPRNVLLSPPPTSHTPSTRSRRGTPRAQSPVIVSTEPADEEMPTVSVLDMAKEVFASDTDFQAVTVIKNPRRLRDSEKLERLRPQIKALKAALLELLKARDAFMAKCPSLDTMINMTTANATASAKKHRAMNQKLQAKVADLQHKVATLDTTCAMLRQRKDELRAEIPQLSEAKRRLSTELDTVRSNIEATQRQVQEYQGEVARLTHEVDAANEKVASLQTALAESKQNATVTVARMSGEHAQAVAELKATSAERLQEVQDRCTQLGARVAELESTRDAASERASDAQQSLISMTAQRDGLQRDCDNFKTTVTRLEVELESTKKNLEEARSRMDKTVQALVEATSAHDSRQDQLSKERQGLQERISALQSEQERLMKLESELKSELKDARHESANLQTRLNEVSANLEAKEADFQQASADAATAREEIESLKASLEEMTAKSAEAEAGLADAKASLTELQHKETVWGKEKELLEHQNNDLRERNKTANDAVASLSEELATVKESCGASNKAQFTKLCEVSKEAAQLRVQMTNMEELREALEEARKANAQLTTKLFDNEMVRRKLHNTIQELRGNIRVFVRVRPILDSDKKHDAGGEDGGDADVAMDGEPTEVIRCSADETHVAVVPNASCRKAKASYGFTFDRIFGQRTTQQDVFAEVSDLVQSALDGYNVCLFSYGQTGSGKTHTMQGMPGEDSEGLIPRSIKKILSVTQAAAREGWKYTLEASFLEIYNETLNDLLRKENSDHHPTLSVHLDADGTVDVHNLTRVKVAESSTIGELMDHASRMRSVGYTSMNARSSRSHSVFTLRIRGTNASRKVVVTGTLNLVDLAGSERLSRSQAEGARLKETQSINKSLSCLSDVFVALSNNAKHIPFRNSKLTFLLQNCFRGDGKTLMMVNLSPHASSTNESLCSLRFASTVSQVHMGKAKRKMAALPEHGADNDASSGAGGAGSGARPRTASATKRTSGAKRPATASSRLMAGTAASSSKRRGTTERASKRRARPGWN